MTLRIPYLVLLFAAIGVCGLLSVGTARAEIRTGFTSIEMLAPPPSTFPGSYTVSSSQTTWDVVTANYYSPSYPVVGGFLTSGISSVSASISESSDRTLAINGARIPSSDFLGSTQSVQFFTGALDLGALMGPDQTFFGTTLISLFGEQVSQVWRFGFSVTMPETPSPLYGWLELDGSASTLGNLVVNATWAYDTTGAPIAVGTVPEPTTLVLVGLGGLALLARFRFGRKQS